MIKTKSIFKFLFILVFSVSMNLAFASKVMAMEMFSDIFKMSRAGHSSSFYFSYEQRILLTYLLAAVGKSEQEKMQYIKRATNYFLNYYSLDRVKVEVKNYPEFITKFRGEWPNRSSVDEDLDIIERDLIKNPPKEFFGKTIKLHNKINNYLWDQLVYLKDLGKGNGAVSEILSPVDWELVKDLINIEHEIREQAIIKLYDEVEKVISKALYKMEHVGEHIAQSSAIDIPNKGVKALLEITLSHYFTKLNLDAKKSIVSQFLGADLAADDLSKFEFMVLNSGPIFQKLLQILAREGGFSEDLLKVFRRLESSAKSIPPDVVKDLFESERANYNWLSYELKPIGVGTMAQAHRAKISYADGKIISVVVRFLKPGIEALVREDHRILSEIAPLVDANPDIRAAKFPKLVPIVNQLAQTVFVELSQEDTEARQKIGSEKYNKSVLLKSKIYKNFIEFKVPKIYPPNETSTKLMVQEMVFGKKLDKVAEEYKDTIPNLKQAVVEEISKMWIEEVLFKSGFFHSDLHQGNFLVQVEEKSIKVSILDFGMGGSITSKMQRDVLVLGVASQLLKPDVLSKTLWSLSDIKENLLDRRTFVALVNEKINRIKHKMEKKIALDDWVSWSMDQGLRFPFIFVSMNRGLMIIDKMLEEIGSNKTSQDIVVELAKYHPKRVFDQITSDGRIKFTDLINLGWIQYKERRNQQPLRCEHIFATE